MKQQPDTVSVDLLVRIAACFVVVTGIAVAIAWVLVRAPAGSAAARPSVLEHGLVDQAAGGDAYRAAGLAKLAHLQRTIDAVVADPRLIGGTR